MELMTSGSSAPTRENAGGFVGIFGFEGGDQLDVRRNLAGFQKLVNFFAEQRLAADNCDGGPAAAAMR